MEADCLTGTCPVKCPNKVQDLDNEFAAHYKRLDDTICQYFDFLHKHGMKAKDAKQLLEWQSLRAVRSI